MTTTDLAALVFCWLASVALVAYLAYRTGAHNAIAKLTAQRREELRRGIQRAAETLRTEDAPGWNNRGARFENVDMSEVDYLRSQIRAIDGADVRALRAAQREGGGDR